MTAARDLERLVLADAQTWAREAARELRDEHRAAEGGWPKTLSEARSRVFALLSSLPGALASLEEQERLARVAYAAARRAWASQADGADR